MGIISMSLNSWLLKIQVVIVLLGSVSVAFAVEVCPVLSDQPLQYADVFDGSPDELASLVPDVSNRRSGYWRVDYVYRAGRFVTVRCKYAQGKVVDVKLPELVKKCSYSLDHHNVLKINCRK